MKQTRSLINGLVGCGVALALVSTLAAQTPIDGKATVIGVKGAARYIVGNTGWKPLKLGQVLKPGTVVQTDMNMGSYVDLVLGEGRGSVPVVGSSSGPTGPVGYNVPTAPGLGKSATSQNVVRVWENSVLGIDKLTYFQTGADVVSETQLNLKAGHIMGVVKKMPAASKYEITIPDGVAGIRGTVYELWANGKASASDGSMVLVRTKKTSGESGAATSGTTGSSETTTTEISNGQCFDPDTGQTSQMSPEDHRRFDRFRNDPRHHGGDDHGHGHAEDHTHHDISNR